MTRNTRTLRLLVPTMLTFFTMGFVDSVGIATNYINCLLYTSPSPRDA